MKRAIVTLCKGLIAVLMMFCVVSGVILMMCECPDWKTQRMTLFSGFGLFILGILPGAIISVISTRKENRVNGRFYR